MTRTDPDTTVTREARLCRWKSAQSALLDYVSGRVEGMEMPPVPKRDKFAAFTKEEVELVRAWIEQGAAQPADLVLKPNRQ